jgi:hypothetical protein
MRLERLFAANVLLARAASMLPAASTSAGCSSCLRAASHLRDHPRMSCCRLGTPCAKRLALDAAAATLLSVPGSFQPVPFAHVLSPGATHRSQRAFRVPQVSVLKATPGAAAVTTSAVLLLLRSAAAVLNTPARVLIVVAAALASGAASDLYQRAHFLARSAALAHARS